MNLNFVKFHLLISFICFSFEIQSQYFEPFSIDSEYKEAYFSTDSVYTVFDFILVDSLKNKVLFDNSSFLTEIIRTENMIRFNNYIPVKNSPPILLSTYYLLFYENCYEFTRVFNPLSLSPKSISQIKKLDIDNQILELLIGIIHGSNDLYIQEFINLQNTNLMDLVPSTYPFLTTYLEKLGLLQRVSGVNYKSTGICILNTKIESCKP
jgi:hypothetical protein